MKKTTTIICALALCLSINLGYGQDVFTVDGWEYSGNEQDISKLPKMDKDIYILQNILNDLFNGSGERSFYRSSRSSKGIYIPNNGVIFNIGGNSIFGSGYQSWDDLLVVVDGEAQKVSKDYSEEDLDKLNNEKESKLKDLALTFLTNYGSLLAELQDNEKIQLSVNYSLHVRSSSRRIDGQLAFVSSSKEENKRRLVTSVTVKDIKDFESGKINLEQMKSRVTSKTDVIGSGDMVDAKIMAGIFDDLFKRTYDGYLSRSGRTSWTYFEGFGLMYSVNLSSRSNGLTLSSDNGTITYNQSDKTVKADDFYKEIKDGYPGFESMVKENIIKYARTLRSLKSNEVVIVNVNVSANKRAQLPKTVQFMVSKSDIDAFAKGQKSLSQVKESISIKKLSASLNNGGLPGHFHGSVEQRSHREAVLAQSIQAVKETQPVRGNVRVRGNN